MSNDNLMPMFKDQCEVSQSSTTYNAFDIYLDEDIKDPTYYRQAFQVLRSAQQGDLVRIYISSNGGNMNSAAMFKNCIENCEADVIAIIEAVVSSSILMVVVFYILGYPISLFGQQLNFSLPYFPINPHF